MPSFQSGVGVSLGKLKIIQPYLIRVFSKWMVHAAKLIWQPVVYRLSFQSKIYGNMAHF